VEKNKMDMTVETYNNVVNEYIDYYNSKGKNDSIQFKKEIDYLVNNLKDKSTILDVGTAIGDYPKYLTEKCNKDFKVIGIDSSENMIEVAKKNAPKAEFKVMDIRNLDFKSKSFDAIICFVTLIHIDDKTCLEVLDKFNLIIKDNGIIEINVMELKNNIKETFIDEPLNPKYKTYFNYYTKRFFTDYFSSKNYEIVSIYDNKLYNAEKLNEEEDTTNIFSVIVRKG
jgi:ubiquinone/menaquinone biosynthesis C-methylase UbiE